MSEEKNSKSELQKEQRKKSKLNAAQYKLLLSCSERKDITDWNKYRNEHRNEKIWLEGAYLRIANLQGADLSNTNLRNANLSHANLRDADLKKANLQGASLDGDALQGASFQEANLEGADLSNAHLQGAYLCNANLRDADLRVSNLQGANFREANLQGVLLLSATLEGVDFSQANLQDADLWDANLQDAEFWRSNLQSARLSHTNMKGASLMEANLKSADLSHANLRDAYLQKVNLEGAKLEYTYLQNTWLLHTKLQGANFTAAIVDGGTLIWGCEVNCYSKGEYFTDFEGVGLNSMRINPQTKQLLEYNIRRKNWEEWYTGKSRKIKNKWIQLLQRIITRPIRWFWAISDYGISTGRIIAVFFMLAFIFACVYSVWSDCIILSDGSELRGFLHALYFSVVTMTTLGFGDIYANPDNWVGQVLLMVQVIFGYVLLGALVTRFAVLFTASGPIGKFVPMDKETKELLATLRELKAAEEAPEKAEEEEEEIEM